MAKPPRAPRPPSSSNFIRQIIEADLASGKHKRICTRFPPEPNGYLHFGHAKSICLNFGLAKDYGGRCNPRFAATHRGTFPEPGRDSPCRIRPPAENLRLLREMRDGKHADGAHVLRARIDMASPNINLRDPVIYRIKKATHHRTGDTWCLYPMYTYAHPIEDALEHVTHSVCTLEFEDQRPFYAWLLERLAQ